MIFHFIFFIYWYSEGFIINLGRTRSYISVSIMISWCSWLGKIWWTLGLMEDLFINLLEVIFVLARKPRNSGPLRSYSSSIFYCWIQSVFPYSLLRLSRSGSILWLDNLILWDLLLRLLTSHKTLFYLSWVLSEATSSTSSLIYLLIFRAPTRLLSLFRVKKGDPIHCISWSLFLLVDEVVIHNLLRLLIRFSRNIIYQIVLL
jgi:hypothetical protein